MHVGHARVEFLIQELTHVRYCCCKAEVASYPGSSTVKRVEEPGYEAKAEVRSSSVSVVYTLRATFEYFRR